jgi:phosphoribosylformimino-5-aminoimidazole carboxamide ribotide isomerase
VDAIPVLDLMGGRVVQGLRGERRRYRAVRSRLVRGSEPVAVAAALLGVCGGTALYVADLDAIAGAGHHEHTIRALSDALGAETWVDAGVRDAERALRLIDAGAARVIVGTETLPDLDALRALQAALPAERMLVSLDIGEHGVISACRALRGQAPLDALALLAGEGASDVILLALRHVGTGEGPDLTTLRAARTAFPTLGLIAGGGVHSAADLRALADGGAHAVLLATALHRGWITLKDIAAVRAEDGPVTSAP